MQPQALLPERQEATASIPRHRDQIPILIFMAPLSRLSRLLIMVYISVIFPALPHQKVLKLAPILLPLLLALQLAHFPEPLPIPVLTSGQFREPAPAPASPLAQSRQREQPTTVSTSAQYPVQVPRTTASTWVQFPAPPTTTTSTAPPPTPATSLKQPPQPSLPAFWTSTSPHQQTTTAASTFPTP